MRVRARIAVVMMVAVGWAGCLAADDPDRAASTQPDLPVTRVADDWYDLQGPETYVDHLLGFYTGQQAYHTLDELSEKIVAWNETYPDLVDVRVIGHSIEKRPIWDVIVTDERFDTAADGAAKLTPLLDGGHHANELGGIEYTLYTVDFLLENHATNATVRQLLRDLAVHVVPLVNPDGYVRQTRGNALGVNLNRNYDIDWGNPLGASNFVMGTLAHATGQAMPSVTIVAENCGSGPFSEPETQAMRDLMHELAPTAAFYLTGHTPTHAVISPWAAYEHPFEIPADHHRVLEAELQWIREHTQYEAGKAEWANFSAGLPYSASGSSMDYFYVVAEKPAFTVEVEWFATAVTSDAWPTRQLQPFEGLRYWMDATLPLSMHLLLNAQALADWDDVPDTTLVPEGSVPPVIPRHGVTVPHL
jgi:carboxypeptidase T